ncbi:MAG: DinB family protein [Thermoanaerobaculia bacterium]
MPLTPVEREELIGRYEAGPDKLRAAFETVPEQARQWRPGPDRWSAHEIVCHAADSETSGAMRIRFLVSEKDPLIQGYDEAQWARDFDYHRHSTDLAFAAVAAVRANTAALVRRFTEEQWSKAGRHSDSGPYSAETWLRIYAEHLEKHSRQIGRNLEAWKAGGRAGGH